MLCLRSTSLSLALQATRSRVQSGAARSMTRTSSSSSAAAPAGASPTHAHPKSDYFIDRVKAAGANAMLGIFHASGTRFDSSLKGMNITNIGNGTVSAVMDVTLDLSNAYGTLHGGATSTIIDIVGTMALLTIDPSKPGVSVDLNVSFMAPAKVGDSIRIEAKTWRAGKKLGFCQVDIYRASDGAAVATGRHTKAL